MLPRVLIALAACLAVAAVTVGGRLVLGASGAGSIKTDAAARPRATVGCPAGGNARSCAAFNPAAASATASPSPAAPHHPARTASPAPKPRPASPPASPTAAPAVSPSASATPVTSVSAAAASVLALINQARAQAGLPAYTILSGLQVSSVRHNQLMAGGCGLSHQCPGEPDLGTRETAAGVHWTAAGENIGEGGPVADTTAAITQMADALTQDMLNEKPPDDGHRLNILSSAFTSIGIAVVRSADGTVWMTQDFAN
jgi:uncharacterized protein YkwD